MTSKIHLTDLDRDVLFISKKERTFVNDDSLPSLPVPPLHQTLQQYLDSVIVHVSDEEYRNTQALVAEFERGEGAKLHAKLKEKSKRERNWLEKWWEDIAYLSQRSPMIPLMNMAGYVPDVMSLAKNQIEISALNIHYYAQFWKLIRTEQLRPYYNSKNIPWSMDQFLRLFNTCRIPGETKDRLVNYFKTESEGEQGPTHIIVLCKGHIFAFDIVDDRGEPLTALECERQLRYISDLCSSAGQGPGLGSLTVADRLTWAKNREWLSQLHPKNKEALEIIESSMFVVVLDENSPLTPSQIICESLGGDCHNRWADKSMTLINFKNGIVGSNADHTPFDGMVTLGLGYYVALSIKDCNGVWNGTRSMRNLPNPQRLKFVIDDRIITAVESARLQFRELANDVQCFCDGYSQYGKDFLRPLKLHPEAYVQMALQLAYYRLHGRPAPTYVTASTRQFYHGRTEPAGPVFRKPIDWVKSMMDDVTAPSEQMKLLRRAIEKFTHLMAECTNNRGCDRHFLGLFMICMENGDPIPEIFLDPSWEKSGGSGKFVLSTSCTGYTSITGGVMPMVENGYGCFYNVENNRIGFCITAFRKNPETVPERLFESLCHALSDMQYIVTTSNL
ncbi:peroxisomal carnitine O-octanoyltransferase [Centruroides vittatus]|uniref:peroxisomal carnitine O-octanoyltransferase n=1 Tax=Centruroides vittatus TaxID=120091 RepID=UPI0035107A6B